MAKAAFRWRVVRFPMMGGLVLSTVLILMGCSSGDDALGASAAGESASDTSVDFGGDTETEPADGESTDAGESDDAEDADETEVTDETESSPATPSDTEDDDVAAVEAEVERVIQRNWEIWVECTTDTESCDPAMALAETESTTSRFYMESVEVVELWKREGIVYRSVDGRPADRFVEIQSIDVSADRTSAEVLLCDRDDRARFQRGADGEYVLDPDTDFTEDLLLRRVVAEEDGVWKIVDNELLDRRAVTEGIDPLC